MAHLSRWLAANELDPAELTEERLEQFLEHRRAAGYTSWLSGRGLTPIVEYLRREGVVPEVAGNSSAVTPLEGLLQRYQQYLLQERGLVRATLRTYVGVARRFLSARSGEAEPISNLTADDVTAFVVGEARRFSIGTAKLTVTALRSLLRYLYLQGTLSVDLAAAVPAVAGYRLSGLPKVLEPDQVGQLLSSVDRDTPNGRRDFAVLVVLTRLGLRAGEVASLRLDDVHWARGEISVHGKGNRRETLPLPEDVGQAVADYLRWGRPASPCRRLLLTTRAPYRGVASCTVTGIVNRAAARAGLGGLGAHALRHTAATRMLSRGASLPEVAQVLRHRSLGTTAIYAKVDREALRSLCRRWPGGQP
jgi:site-specific recombinase XerD